MAERALEVTVRMGDGPLPPWTGRVHDHSVRSTGPYTPYTIHLNGRHSCIIRHHSILRTFMPSTEVHDNILSQDENGGGMELIDGGSKSKKSWKMDVRTTLVTTLLFMYPPHR